MDQNKPIILIGSLTKENRGAIPTITNAFIEGLQKHFQFIPHYANRNYGKKRISNFNAVNIYYFTKHLMLWTYKLLIHRPDIAHYPITSYWNLEKSLIFLKVAKLCGCKTVGHLHGGAFLEFWSLLSSIRKAWALKRFKELNALIVLSNGWKNKISKNLGIEKKNIYVVHNPIDYRFEQAFSDIQYNRKGNRIKILSVGVMSKKKGVLEILEALKNVKNGYDFITELVGPEREPDINMECRRIINNNALEKNVRIVGEKWGDEKTALYDEADIFLLPSYVENFPLVIIEAACAGLPIITTPVGAIPEFFEHDKSVLFVEPGNKKEIAAAILSLLKSHEKRIRLGHGARNVYLKKLSRRKILRHLDRVYQDLLIQSVL